METRYRGISQAQSPNAPAHTILYDRIPTNTLYVGDHSHKPYPHTDRIVDPEWLSKAGPVMPKYIGLVEAQGVASCGYDPNHDLYAKNDGRWRP
uniref:Uncharacterized protein n=1 Tax=viral metagenome TaxID=1070528 RepID=A0A6C0LXY6_9ZZZZ